MSTGPRHGTRHGYRDDRCKCGPCKKAIALEHNVYLMRRAANGGAPLTVDKLGSVRRLQALMALGWPRRELATCAGYKGDAFALILNGRRQRLTIDTHRRIAALFDELCMTPGPSSSSRIRAASRGWLPPLAWDDIDDPTERPDTADVRTKDDLDPVVVERVLAGDRLPMTTAERREVVVRARGLGWSEEEIRVRTGIAKATDAARYGVAS